MLKKLCLSLLAVSSVAMARTPDLNLQCVTQKPMRNGDSIGWVLTLSLEGKVNEYTDTLEDAIAVVDILDGYQDPGEGKVTGRVRYLRATKGYKPRKYLNHNRYELDQMVDTVHFGRFYPGMECGIEVYLPKDLHTKKDQEFIAPALLHCDQDGGRANLKCSVK